MSFKNASLPIQKSVYNYAKSDFEFEILTALIESSRRNRTIMESDIQQEPGKLRTFKLNFIPPNCDDSGDCSDNLCEPGTKTPPQQLYYLLSQCTSSPKYEFAVEDARDLDNIDQNDYALSMLAANLTTVREKLATEVTALLVTKVGRFADGSITKNLQLVNPTTGIPQPYGINELKRTFRDMRMNQPFVVGGYSAFHLKQGLAIGGLDAQGRQIGQVALPNLYYDNLVNEAYDGGENILAWDPDYLKFMTYSKNAGRFATNLSSLKIGDMFRAGETYMYATIVDPVTKLLWDLDAIYDVCTKVWRFQFRINWDIFFMPPSVCLEPHVNGLVHYVGCALVPTECPEVDDPVVPEPTDFAWEAPGEAVYLATITIGNQTYQPLVTIADAEGWKDFFNTLGIGTFTEDSGDVLYTGFGAITGSYNGGTAITFVAAP